MRTRTTISIDRVLLRRAKVLAAETDDSLSGVIEAALTTLLDSDHSSDEEQPGMRVFQGEPGLRSPFTWKDLERPWELIDRLDREEEADAGRHTA